jgi:hypothetical protein
MKLEVEIAALKLVGQELGLRLDAIEKGEKSSGVFLDGAPDFVVDYLKEVKEGE